MPPPKNMEVEMINSLPSIAPGIDYDTIPGSVEALGAGDGGRERHKSSQHGRIGCLSKRCDMLARNNKYVCRRLRIDIAKRDCILRLGNLNRRNLTPRDLTKKTVFGHE